MSKTLKELEPFFKVLDWKELEKAPTFSELKKIYRAKLHLHPDKAGKGSSEEEKKKMTEAFQEVSEAVHEIFFHLVENVEIQKKGKPADEGTRLLKYFETACEMVYNKGSITFFIDDNLYEAWMEAFERKFGKAREALREKDAWFFRNENLEVSKLENLGKVVVSCWKKPSSDGKSKILLQGKAYMSFLALVIPDIILDISKQNPPAVANNDVEKNKKVVSNDKAVNNGKAVTVVGHMKQWLSY